MKSAESKADQFMRIAEARLRKNHKFKPERKALAAWMYRRWLDRQIAQ